MFYNYSGRHLLKTRKNQLSVTDRLERRLFSVVLMFLLVVIITATTGAVALGLGMFRALIDNAPDISKLDVAPKGYSSNILDRKGNVIQTLSAPNANRQYATLDEIPLYTQKAFVAVEDERFYKHNGIDIEGIMRAFFKGAAKGFRFSEGGSSLTQQLLKNNIFLDWVNESSFSEKLKRKIQEQHLAIMLEKRMSKDQILEFYLNTINLGAGSYGVRAAAYRYFGKDISELTISESAVIAGISKNPSSLNPIRFPEENAKRRATILELMEKQGYITAEQKQEALDDKVYDRIQSVVAVKQSENVYSYFIDELINQVLNDLQQELGYSETQAYYTLYSGGLTIESTQDKRLQGICDRILSDESNYPGVSYKLSYASSFKTAKGELMNFSTEDLIKHFQDDDTAAMLFKSKEAAEETAASYTEYLKNKYKDDTFLSDRAVITPQPQISLTLMNHDNGKVLAIVGGRGQKPGSLTLNRATNTYRQPGSAFKIPGVYAPAIDSADYTLGTVVNDAPYQYSNKVYVNNANRKFKGYTTIRDAITYSTNIVAVKTLTSISPQLGYAYLRSFGISTLTSNDANHQALALGGIEKGVSNLELTAAYAAIANGGEYIKPRFYTRIIDHEGNVLLDHSKAEKTRVIKNTTAYLLIDAMRDVVKRGTSTLCAVRNVDIAGKSGTTNNYRDVWFAGFSPYYTMTVWGGYDDTSSVLPASGTYRNYHKIIWQKVMAEAVKNKEQKEIMQQPDSIVSAKICKASGKLAVDGLCNLDLRGNMVYSELFTKNTVPDTYCDRHIAVELCMDSKLPAGEFCPVGSKKSAAMLINVDSDSSETADAPYIYDPEKRCNIHTTAPVTEYVEESPDDND